MTPRLERPFLFSALAVFKVVLAAVCLAQALRFFLHDRTFDPDEKSWVPILVFAGLALLALACAHGLWTLRPHGLWLQLGFSTLGLVVGFPVGTIFSAIVLWYFCRPGTRLLFSGRPMSSLRREEIEALVAVLPKLHSVPFSVGVILLPLFSAGCIAAIAIPNLTGAIDRGKQKRTMADLRSIGIAIEMYRVDHNQYPVVDSMAALTEQLVPKYLPEVIKRDGWSGRIQARSTATDYTIYSRGMDGEGSNCNPAATTRWNDEICFVNGQFTRYPQGTQQ